MILDRLRLPAIVTAIIIAAAACSSADSDSNDASGGGTTASVATDAEVATASASFTVVPGVQTVTATDARPGAPLTLVSPDGERLVTLVVDEFGQAHFAYLPEEHTTFRTGPGAELPASSGTTLPAGDGYTIRDESTDPIEETEPFEVAARDDVPDETFYSSQTLEDGFGYITMRDGVKLSAMVRLPDPEVYGDGPYPTVVEYSGYGPSNPEQTEPGSMIAGLIGYATVGVNIRGTGCSGGVFDVFTPAQQADGYDIIEVVASQPWVLHGEVGMVGLSYSGITQLYTASTRPPHLAAVTPLSVTEDAWQQLWPGGIYNSGFTRKWLEERDAQAAPGGMSWTQTLIDGGDETCEDNLVLSNQNPDFERLFRGLEFRPDDSDSRDLSLLVGDIEVPVYLTGAWQDEQTGPRFATMLDEFTGTEHERFILFNGRHPDGYSPLVISRWYEFLEFYVAKRVPRVPALLRAAAPAYFESAFGAPGLGFEPDRFEAYADDEYDDALSAYEAEPQVRVLFENGAGGEVPGAPQARFETTFDSWPPPDAEARTWYLGPDESLLANAPADEGADSYEHDAEAGDISFFGPRGYELMAPVWDFDWTQFDEGKGLSYLTTPLTDDLVVAGPGHATLWFASEADDANIQVSVSEVRPDGIEYLVQSGQLRAGDRAIDEDRTDEIQVEHTYSADDYAPIPAGDFVEVKVGIPPFAHAFRAGSRLRITISTPGRNHGAWLFANPDYDGATPDAPSRVRR
ncbi:MAG: CocE/NonD family hydrolase [Acidimicrobiia bacterium]|nr:CocE/NonD family hydrolase [Acidimicrobiia bacterium]